MVPVAVPLTTTTTAQKPTPALLILPRIMSSGLSQSDLARSGHFEMDKTENFAPVLRSRPDVCGGKIIAERADFVITIKAA